MPRTLQILRGNAVNKPFLADGQMFLEKDTGTLVIQNSSDEIRLAKDTDVQTVQEGLSSTNQTLGSISTNVASLNGTVQNIPITHKTSTTISTAGWTPSGSEYFYDVTIADMTSSNNPIIIPQSTNSSQQKNWDSLLRIESFNGYCRLYGSQVFTASVSAVIYY